MKTPGIFVIETSVNAVSIRPSFLHNVEAPVPLFFASRLSSRRLGCVLGDVEHYPCPIPLAKARRTYYKPTFEAPTIESIPVAVEVSVEAEPLHVSSTECAACFDCWCVRPTEVRGSILPW